MPLKSHTHTTYDDALSHHSTVCSVELLRTVSIQTASFQCQRSNLHGTYASAFYRLLRFWNEQNERVERNIMIETSRGTNKVFIELFLILSQELLSEFRK